MRKKEPDLFWKVYMVLMDILIATLAGFGYFWVSFLINKNHPFFWMFMSMGFSVVVIFRLILTYFELNHRRLNKNGATRTNRLER